MNKKKITQLGLQIAAVIFFVDACWLLFTQSVRSEYMDSLQVALIILVIHLLYDKKVK